MQIIYWYLAFTISAILFTWGLFYVLFSKKMREGNFAKAALINFFASWVLYLPVEFFNEIPETNLGLRIIESISTALLRTFNIYLGEGYNRIVIEGHIVFTSVYAILMVLINIVLLLYVAGIIMQFLEGPVQRIKIQIGRNKYTYIFSDCNEKTIAIADSLREGKNKIIFAGIGHETISQRREYFEQAGYIFVENTVTDVIGILGKKTKKIEIFLFHDNEEENLNQLDDICKTLEKDVKNQVTIYVELLKTQWNLYDGFLKYFYAKTNDKVIINFIRTEQNFAYNNLLKTSIFDNAKEDKGVKEIKVMIAGMNERNLEMLKAILHLGQMPGYRLFVMILDAGYGRKKMKMAMPEIYDECDREGDAIYKMYYKEGVDFDTTQVESILSNEFMDFTYAFINIGDDLVNTNWAMRIDTLSRRNLKKGYKIQVNVKNRHICDMWNPQYMERIEIVGDINAVYNYHFIKMSDIEKGTIAIHEVRYPKDNPSSPTWTSYCNNEYNRHSVYARTLSFKYKVWIIDKYYKSNFNIVSDRKWKIYEHMRWNVYTRTLGYVGTKSTLLDIQNLDKKTRNLAKVHNDLVEFEQLSVEEQNKDALKLTTEIVEILRTI